MTEHDNELLSAFFDGERVDRKRLAEALESPAAIEALGHFARLAVDLERAEAGPRPAWVATVRRRLQRPQAERWWRRWVPVPAPALAAAALVLVVAGGWGWYAAQSRSAVSGEHPPAAVRTIAFEAGKDWHRIGSN